jgi:pyrroloquinoline quinone biosynthesis protein D
MKRCDGTRTIAEITADLEREFSLTGLGDDVRNFIVMAVAKRWLLIRP